MLPDYFGEVGEVVKATANFSDETLKKIVDVIVGAKKNEKTVYACGNGGSASLSDHFCCDLFKSCGVKSISLTSNTALLTALANDIDYSHIFSEQLGLLLQKGDVVIGISASGCSCNVIEAIRLAKEVGATTIGLTGMGGGILKNEADIVLIVPSDKIQVVEDIHLIICHLISLLVKERG